MAIFGVEIHPTLFYVIAKDAENCKDFILLILFQAKISQIWIGSKMPMFTHTYQLKSRIFCGKTFVNNSQGGLELDLDSFRTKHPL